MKIIKEQFDTFAREQGYASGAELFDDLGLNAEYYAGRREEVRIGGKVLEMLCREIGAAEVREFVRFEPGEEIRYRKILEEF